MALPTFKAGWSVRREYILEQFLEPSSPSRAELLGLGGQLASIFQLIGKGERSNAGTSGGGAVWAALVAWYLNLGYAGTDAIAFCGGTNAPEPLKDAMSVTYSNTSLRSDSDILVVCLPGISSEVAQATERTAFKRLTNLVEEQFNTCGLVNVQCKTTWNDNAQIPMLWNMIFQQAMSGTTPPSGFLLGKNGFHVRNLGHFSYAFATVPTVSKGPAGIKPTGMPVRRVASLSGGAFWGHPTHKSVCRSLSEFFGHQYSQKPSIMPNVGDVGNGYVEALGAKDSKIDVGAFGMTVDSNSFGGELDFG